MKRKNTLMVFVLSSVLILGGFTGNEKAFAQPVLFGLAHSGSDGPSTLFSIDKTTGVATPIGATGFERCSGMDFNPGDSTMYATCERSDGSDTLVLVSINLSTGAATEVGIVGSHSFGETVADISFRNLDNTLYAYLEDNDGLGTIAVGTGTLTELGSTGVNCCGNGMGFDPADTLHHTNQDTMGTLDQVIGSQTDGPDMVFSPPMDDFPRINAMDWDDSTSTMFGSCNDGTAGSPENYLCTVALGSGITTVIGPTEDGLDAIAFFPVVAVGGSDVSISTTSLLLAGVQSVSMWMIPVVLAGVVIGVFVISKRK